MPPKSHGETQLIEGKRIATPEYRSWQAMKDRCLNPKGKNWRYYGGRDIKICDDWLCFENFLDDMGRRPSVRHTLERRDGNKDYSKENCYWATRQQQSRNRAYVRLSPTIAQEIREVYAQCMIRQVDLATRYGITQAHVSQIIRGVTWRKEDEQGS